MSKVANPFNRVKAYGVGGGAHYLKRAPLPSSATTSWTGTYCGQLSWAYSGRIGQHIELLLVQHLLLLSHVSGGRGEDACELTVGTIELLEGKEESGTPGVN